MSKTAISILIFITVALCPSYLPAAYLDYDPTLSTVLNATNEHAYSKNQYEMRETYFDNKSLKDYTDFLNRPILLIDVSPEVTQAVVLDPSKPVSTLDKLNPTAIPTDHFLESGVEAFSPLMQNVNYVLVTGGMYQGDLAKTHPGTASTPPVFEENRTKALARGIQAWSRLHNQSIDYPVLVDDSEATPLLMSATGEITLLNAYNGLTPQRLLDRLLVNGIGIRTAFRTSGASGIVRRIDVQDMDNSKKTLRNRTDLPELKTTHAMRLGASATAVQLYRLVPDSVIYAPETSGSDGEADRMLRRLRYLYELSGGELACPNTPLRPLGNYWEQLLHIDDLTSEEVRLMVLVWQQTTDKRMSLATWMQKQRQDWTNAKSNDLIFVWTARQIEGASWIDWASAFLTKNNRLKVEDVRAQWTKEPRRMPFNDYLALVIGYKSQGLDTGTEMDFNSWLLWRQGKLPEQDASVDLQRWEQIGLKEAGLPFDTYRLQQSLKWIGPPRPLAQLSPEQRKLYQVELKDGRLTRNGKPYRTSFEGTAVSGPGYAIFVIDCFGNMYAASHINRVFYHSSIFSNSPVKAAGEIRTDESGKVIYLSNKSGHYWPGRDATTWALNWFQQGGVDLNTVPFHSSTEFPKVLYPSATQYLNKK